MPGIKSPLRSWLLGAVLCAAFSATSPVWPSYGIYVGKNLTADGSVLLGGTGDEEPPAISRGAHDLDWIIPRPNQFDRRVRDDRCLVAKIECDAGPALHAVASRYDDVAVDVPNARLDPNRLSLSIDAEELERIAVRCPPLAV